MIFLSILRQDSDLSKHLVGRWRPSLSPRADRRPVSTAAYALLYDTIASVFGLDAREISLDHTQTGRPYLRQTGLHRPPSVSVSHSRGWIACALTDIGDIGIDIELAKPGRDISRLAHAAFGPLEIADVGRYGDASFYRIWSLREAQAKALGQGLALAADRHDRTPLLFDDNMAHSEFDGMAWGWVALRPASDLYLGLALRHTNETATLSTTRLQTCHVSKELDLRCLGCSHHTI